MLHEDRIKIDRPLWHIVQVFERARSVEAEKASVAPGNVAPVTADTPDTPPTVRPVPSERTFHGDTVTDEFSWLADKESSDTSRSDPDGRTFIACHSNGVTNT